MDGTIDDPLWGLAEPITNFAQREPYEGNGGLALHEKG